MRKFLEDELLRKPFRAFIQAGVSFLVNGTLGSVLGGALGGGTGGAGGGAGEFSGQESRCRFQDRIGSLEFGISRRSARSTSDSSALWAARSPESISAWRTHLRTVSAVPTQEVSNPAHRFSVRGRGSLRDHHLHHPLLQLVWIPP